MQTLIASLSPKLKATALFVFCYVIGFTMWALVSGNIEFLFYTGVVVAFFLLLIIKQQKLQLSDTVLLGLAIWGLLHMAGGNVMVAGDVLYNFWIIPPHWFKYDQLVHAFGFGVTTLVGWELLRPFLTTSFNKVTVGILLAMIGLGAGGLNEIIEFIITVVVPETNVGGYINTALDLVFNLIGATIVAVYIMRTYDKK